MRLRCIFLNSYICINIVEAHHTHTPWHNILFDSKCNKTSVIQIKREHVRLQWCPKVANLLYERASYSKIVRHIMDGTHSSRGTGSSGRVDWIERDILWIKRWTKTDKSIRGQ